MSLTKQQRDLKWVQSAPVFFDSQLDRVVSDAHRNKLFGQLKDCPDLPEFCGSGRLGLYYEYLIHALMKYRFGEDHVLANIQVQKSSNETIGELDFLFFDGIQVCHWEVSIKFYLLIPNLKGWKALVGTGLKDRLDIKGTHTFTRQLNLVNAPEAQKALPEKWRGSVIDSRAFCQGFVFLPWGKECSLPEGVSPKIIDAQIPSYWCAVHDFQEVARHLQLDALVELQRLDWISGPNQMQPLSLSVVSEERMMRVQDRNECIHIFGMRTGQPVARIMIVGSYFMDGIQKLCEELEEPL